MIRLGLDRQQRLQSFLRVERGQIVGDVVVAALPQIEARLLNGR